MSNNDKNKFQSFQSELKCSLQTENVLSSLVTTLHSSYLVAGKETTFPNTSDLLILLRQWPHPSLPLLSQQTANTYYFQTSYSYLKTWH